jgi:hypothetical protein
LAIFAAIRRRASSLVSGLAADRRPGSLGNRPLYNQISGIDSSARREGIGVNVTKPPALPAAVVCQLNPARCGCQRAGNCIGFLLSRGPKDFEAFDRDQLSIGLFTDQHAVPWPSIKERSVSQHESE